MTKLLCYSFNIIFQYNTQCDNNSIYNHLFIKTVISVLLGLVQVVQSKIIIVF